MDDVRADTLAQFTSITDANVAKAEPYLNITDWNLEQAIQLYFDSGGVDLAPTITPSASSNPPAGAAFSTPATAPSSRHHLGRSHSDAIPVDDDDDDDNNDYLDTEAATRRALARETSGGRSNVNIYDDDEAMAQALQQQMYAEAGRDGGVMANEDFDEHGVRAPIARTTETLVGPDEDYIRRMLDARTHRARPTPGVRGPVGIFNQRVPTTGGEAWNEETMTSSERRRRLAAATNGASEASSRASRLAAMYNPPFDLITNMDFATARDLGKERLKWLIVNIQDSGVFDSQVLNRDIWKDPAIKSTIKENFLFLQYAHDSPEGLDYLRLYMNGYAEFPHIGIIDPRTGEQLKTWTRVPDKGEFLLQLHEFLERYSLDPAVKMPVQKTPKAKMDVDHMTEEEMLDLALRNSLGGGGDDSANSSDPDLLTKTEGKQKEATKGEDEDLMQFDEEPSSSASAPTNSVFASISKDAHHVEPPQSPESTRIQFRLPDGTRVVRRFTLADPVRRIYEYVKADLLPEQAQKTGNAGVASQEFELKSLRQNLIEVLDSSIHEAKLGMATIMVDLES